MSLARTENACTLHPHKHIAGSVDRSDQWLSLIGMIFELGPQPVDIDIEGVLLHVGGQTPTCFDQLFARCNRPFPSNKRFKKLELLSRQSNLLTITDGYTTASVEGDACRVHRWKLGGRDASRDSTDAREENLQNEGLDEI